jgi:hypothetical protein
MQDRAKKGVCVNLIFGRVLCIDGPSAFDGARGAVIGRGGGGACEGGIFEPRQGVRGYVALSLLCSVTSKLQYGLLIMHFYLGFLLHGVALNSL